MSSLWVNFAQVGCEIYCFSYPESPSPACAPRLSIFLNKDGVRLSTRGKASFRLCVIYGNSESGVHSQQEARAKLEGCTLYGSPGMPQKRGALAIEKGVIALAGGSINRHAEEGVLAESGAEVALTGVVVEGQGGFGLRFTGGGTKGEMRDCRVRDGRLSAGLIVDGNSAVMVNGCW